MEKSRNLIFYSITDAQSHVLWHLVYKRTKLNNTNHSTTRPAPYGMFKLKRDTSTHTLYGNNILRKQ